LSKRGSNAEEGKASEPMESGRLGFRGRKKKRASNDERPIVLKKKKSFERGHEGKDKGSREGKSIRPGDGPLYQKGMKGRGNPCLQGKILNSESSELYWATKSESRLQHNQKEDGKEGEKLAWVPLREEGSCLKKGHSLVS